MNDTNQNQQVHPADGSASTEQPTDALTVMTAATNLTAFGHLYLFVKHARTVRDQAALEAGKLVQVSLRDGSDATIAVNSNLLLPVLIGEFQRLGDEIEKNNISVARLLDSLEKQFQQSLQSAAQKGG